MKVSRRLPVRRGPPAPRTIRPVAADRTITVSAGLPARTTIGSVWSPSQALSRRRHRKRRGHRSLDEVHSASLVRSGHAVVGRPIGAGGKAGLGELEAPSFVVLNVGFIRGVQMASDMVGIDNREPGCKQCRANPATLAIRIDAQSLQIPNWLVWKCPLQSSA